MKKLRAAASALLLAALLTPTALGGVMEADVASPQPTPTPVTAESSVAPTASAAPASSVGTVVEVALDVVRAILALF